MRLKVLPFLVSDASRQMELDTLLFTTFCVGHDESTIRFYKISPPAITIGYHQREDSVRRTLEDCSIDIVRRPTGGRAVVHLGDLTYTIIGGVGNCLFGANILDIYHAIGKGVKRGIDMYGVGLDFVTEPDLSSSPFCFELSSKHELAYAGKKVAGGALLKRYGRFLFQGSILLEPLQGHRGLSGILGLSEITGGKTETERLVEAIVEGFREEFGAEIVHGRWPEAALTGKVLLS